LGGVTDHYSWLFINTIARGRTKRTGTEADDAYLTAVGHLRVVTRGVVELVLLGLVRFRLGG
jgi:hypothetical protein